MGKSTNHGSNGLAPSAARNGKSQAGSRPPGPAWSRLLRFYARQLVRRLLVAVRHWEARTSLASRRRQVLAGGVATGLLWFSGFLWVLRTTPAPGGLGAALASSRQVIADTLQADSIRQVGIYRQEVHRRQVRDSLRSARQDSMRPH